MIQWRQLRPIPLLGWMVLAGCADTKKPTTRPMSARDRQDQAIQDPFGYGPQPGTGRDMPSVTGGSAGEFDRKGFDRDVDRLLNP